MSFFSTIKKNAKLVLRGHWGTAIGINSLVAAIFLITAFFEQLALKVFVIAPFAQNPTMEPAEFDFARFTLELFAVDWVEILIVTAFALLSVLLLSPLSLGAVRWFYSLTQEEKPGFGELFRFFETPRRYFRALWYTIQLNIRCWFWGILFFVLPCGLLGVYTRFLTVSGVTRQTRAAATIGVIMAGALILLTILLYTIFVNKYALTPYILCESDDITVGEAFRLSIHCTKGYRVSLTLFSLSFLGWYLLSPFTLFLLVPLFVAPYQGAAMALMARYLTEKGRPPKGTQEFNRGHYTP